MGKRKAPRRSTVEGSGEMRGEVIMGPMGVGMGDARCRSEGLIEYSGVCIDEYGIRRYA
jgi:hypothetical protein